MRLHFVCKMFADKKQNAYICTKKNNNIPPSPGRATVL